MATIKFPSSLTDLNIRLSECITAKKLQPLELGEISFETFIKSLYPFLMRYADQSNAEQLQLLKRQIIQVFPLPGAGIQWYRLFNTVIGHLLGQSVPVTFQTTLELSALILQLSPKHRMEDLLEVQFQIKTPKERAEKLQLALSCLLAEEQLMRTSVAQTELLRPLFGLSTKIPSDLTDPKIFGALLKYTVNATILRQSLTELNQRTHHQYLRARELMDKALQDLPIGCMPFDSSEAFVQNEWKKRHIQQNNDLLATFIVTHATVFNLMCPIGSWVFEAADNLIGQPLHELYWSEREAMNQRYLEFRSQQAAVYDLLYSQLHAIYDQSRNKRELVGYLKDLTTGSKTLPKSFPPLEPIQIPDFNKHLASITPTEKSTSPLLFTQDIESYSQAVAKNLDIPYTIPEDSKSFWELASRAFTYAADLAVTSGRKAHFIHPQNKQVDTMYLVGAEMTRENGEIKRGIIYYGIDKTKKCFYRYFSPLMDLEVVTTIGSTSLLSDAFPGLNVATLQREGNFPIDMPHSLPWQLDSSGMILQDFRLGMKIQLFSVS